MNPIFERYSVRRYSDVEVTDSQIENILKNYVPVYDATVYKKLKEPQLSNKVVLVDDLIATGGTVEAIAKLVEELGGEVVKILFLMELAGENGIASYGVIMYIQFIFLAIFFRSCCHTTGWKT